MKGKKGRGASPPSSVCQQVQHASPLPQSLPQVRLSPQQQITNSKMMISQMQELLF